MVFCLDTKKHYINHIELHIGYFAEVIRGEFININYFKIKGCIYLLRIA